MWEWNGSRDPRWQTAASVLELHPGSVFCIITVTPATRSVINIPGWAQFCKQTYSKSKLSHHPGHWTAIEPRQWPICLQKTTLALHVPFSPCWALYQTRARKTESIKKKKNASKQQKIHERARKSKLVIRFCLDGTDQRTHLREPPGCGLCVGFEQQRMGFQTRTHRGFAAHCISKALVALATLN